MTVGGDKLDYPNETALSAASLIKTKLLSNSVISDHLRHNSRFCATDFKDFSLKTPMERPEYLRIHSKCLSADLRKEYQLDDMINGDGYVYCQINKGMYGLKQAAILAYRLLVQRLSAKGYHPIPLTNGLFKHQTRATTFALYVDDFGIKYNNQDDLQHLIDTLKEHYEILIDLEGKNYCGLMFQWHYKLGYVDVSMPKYVLSAIKKFGHPYPRRPEYSPHKWTQPAYRQRIQYVTRTEAGTPLNTTGKRQVQSIVGTFLYYGHAVDPTILAALNEISTHQARPTNDTVK